MIEHIRFRAFQKDGTPITEMAVRAGDGPENALCISFNTRTNEFVAFPFPEGRIEIIEIKEIPDPCPAPEGTKGEAATPQTCGGCKHLLTGQDEGCNELEVCLAMLWLTHADDDACENFVPKLAEPEHSGRGHKVGRLPRRLPSDLTR